MTTDERINSCGIVPVVVLDDAKDALSLAGALREGGLPVAEVTFRTDAAEEAIRLISSTYPDMLVGAGTVLTKEQADQAEEAGVSFIVSPGLNPNIVRYVQEKGIPMMPGVCTPSEIETAMELGIKEMKFFPAEAAGGLKMIKALCGPYRDVLFMPTGGITAKNAGDYLKYEKILCCGGTWMVSPALIRDGKFEEIERLTAEAAEIVKEVRG